VKALLADPAAPDLETATTAKGNTLLHVVAASGQRTSHRSSSAAPPRVLVMRAGLRGPGAPPASSRPVAGEIQASLDGADRRAGATYTGGADATSPALSF
jgi:hypothetical protein